MEKETNFIDLCMACGRGIGRAFKACWELFLHMVQLTYRYWWVVLTIVALGIAAALYYSRRDNLTFKVNAVALINGPSIQQFEQAFTPLRSNQLIPDEAPIKALIGAKIPKRFDTFRVIDCLHDGVADYVDFKRKSSPTDTLKVQMQDRLNLQFRIKYRDMDKVPAVEYALLDFLNANHAMQQSYEVYLANLRYEAAFNHRQALKLDSLTSHYYYYTPSSTVPPAYVGNGVNFYGERRIHLFLDKIYDQHDHMQLVDYRAQLATAPVVLENHFSVDPKPVNGRKKCLVILFLLGWIGGCVLAELIDRRKAICAWLKQ